MTQSYLKRTIFMAIMLISFNYSKQTVTFTVESLETEESSCSITQAKYEFKIKGKFSSITYDTLTLDLETSNQKKIKAECTPLNLVVFSQFLCEIDIAKYPLDKVDIIFPTTAPNTKSFTFQDWDKVIGKQPGVSNKISKVDCKLDTHTFIPSSISLEGCFLGETSFRIYGKWENESPLADYSLFELILDNDRKDNAQCSYNANPVYFDCSFEGEGRLKINEQNFVSDTKSCLIKAIDSGKTVKKCKDDGIMKISGSFNSLNIILIVISLLLF